MQAQLLPEQRRIPIACQSKQAQRASFGIYVMTIQTQNLILATLLPRHLRALLRGPDEFENTAGLRVADGVRDHLLSASSEYLARLETAKQADPWQFGFAIVHKPDNVLIGMCGFVGPPNSDGIVEFGYAIAPTYRARGYATEAAAALVEFASSDPRVKLVRAHTLAETNASTRVLEKCGFKKVEEIIDPENGLPAWRWDRPVAKKL